MEDILDRFFDFIEIGDATDDCWIWIGGRNLDGYGRFTIEKKRHLAHRLSYELFHGSIPEDRPHVLHSCDNPPCVNPHHLHAGTHKENMEELVARGRHRGFGDGWIAPSHNGEKNGRSKLTEADVLDIRTIGSSLTLREIGVMFGVSHVAVAAVLQRKTWKHI